MPRIAEKATANDAAKAVIQIGGQANGTPIDFEIKAERAGEDQHQ